MKDKDQKLIWETLLEGGVPGHMSKDDKAAHIASHTVPPKEVIDKTSAELDKDSAEEETYEERGQRGEGRGLLKALSSWIETARGDQLKRAYESILKAYQIAGYPEPGGDREEIERDDDYRGEDPSPRETDQDRYGYPGDR